MRRQTGSTPSSAVSEENSRPPATESELKSEARSEKITSQRSKTAGGAGISRSHCQSNGKVLQRPFARPSYSPLAGCQRWIFREAPPVKHELNGEGRPPPD